LLIEELERRYRGWLPDDAAVQGILQIGRRMYERGYAAANDGNITCLAGPDAVWATPTGVSKGFMTAEMLIKLDFGRRVLEGAWTPSTELMMHLRVYRENPDVKAVIHAHSPAATAFACAGIPLDQPILAEAVSMQGQTPVAPFALPGTPALAESVAPFCRDYRGVLLANHGVLTWGVSLTEAFYRLERIEYYANLLILTGFLPRPVKPISKADIESLKGSGG